MSLPCSVGKLIQLPGIRQHPAHRAGPLSQGARTASAGVQLCSGCARSEALQGGGLTMPLLGDEGLGVGEEL